MRRFLVVVVLAACAPHSASGPAWPKAATTETDGGESLEPHESHQVAEAIEKSDAAAKPTAAAAAPTVAPTDVVAPVVAPSVSQPIEDTITTEDIIIEIDD